MQNKCQLQQIPEFSWGLFIYMYTLLIKMKNFKNGMHIEPNKTNTKLNDPEYQTYQIREPKCSHLLYRKKATEW